MTRHPKHDHADNDRIQGTIDGLPELMLLECSYCHVRFESSDGAEQGEGCNECGNGIITIAVDYEPTEAEETQRYRNMEICATTSN